MEIQNKILLNMAIKDTRTQFSDIHTYKEAFVIEVKATYKLYKKIHEVVNEDESQQKL